MRQLFTDIRIITDNRVFQYFFLKCAIIYSPLLILTFLKLKDREVVVLSTSSWEIIAYFYNIPCTKEVRINDNTKAKARQAGQPHQNSDVL